jgi:hypothetical protein
MYKRNIILLIIITFFIIWCKKYLIKNYTEKNIQKIHKNDHGISSDTIDRKLIISNLLSTGTGISLKRLTSSYNLNYSTFSNINRIKIYEFGTVSDTIDGELKLYNSINKCISISLNSLTTYENLKYSTINLDTINILRNIFINNVSYKSEINNSSDNRLVIAFDCSNNETLYISIINERQIIFENYIVNYEQNILQLLKNRIPDFNNIVPFQTNMILKK